MLIIILLLALIRTLHGSPLSLASTEMSLEQDTDSKFGQRDLSNIILSCFATVFACTWSAVHPNIPSPWDSWWDCFKRQLVTMIYALVAPEAMTAWALRQHLAARKIMNSYNKQVMKVDADAHEKRPNFSSSSLSESDKIMHERPWTLTHAFFVQMGGFMLCEDGRPIQTLIYSTADDEVGIRKNIADGKIDIAMLSVPEEDIQDRSKGDAISKAFIVVQTTWFIVHCIARWIEKLPLTELEVVTLGFALLNGITYALWWFKPQNVVRPIFLESKIKKDPVSVKDVALLDPKVSFRDRKAVEAGDLSEVTDVEEEPVVVEKPSWLHRKLQEDFDEYHSHAPYRLLYTMPLRLGEALLRPLGQLTETGARSHEVQKGSLRVPMFHSEEASDIKVFGATSIVGVLFGSVHLITGWFLDFTSHRQMLLWRAASIVITVEPIFMGLWKIFPTDGWMWHILRSLMVAGLPFYIVARLVLLLISLLSLRGLPPAAFENLAVDGIPYTERNRPLTNGVTWRDDVSEGEESVLTKTPPGKQSKIVLVDSC
ncbi:hypothetical protein BDN70DRAFT_950675 [Pholiota conissans]|uniref:Uncharacterized protein n=1 Tax=Pholiota conissans TaxID=109636 RepID=A0A9P5Z9S9_9AGAR|nr:hypothetical protein BDN70DRAFT_950675 [Pholiota conissans]